VANEVKQSAQTPDQLAAEVEFLADEVKLLAINLAIALANLQGQGRGMKELEPRFTELIRRANDTSLQVSEALRAFRSRTGRQCGLPASSEVVVKRGAYDGVEARLNHIYDLSRDIIREITKLKSQGQVG
jgi:hypothetical protein